MVSLRNGRLRLRMISASPGDTLQRLTQLGIILRRVRQVDALTVTFIAQQADLDKINRLIQSRGDRLEVLDHQGAFWGLRRLIHRPVLVFGVLFLVFLSIFLPTRVLFIRVEGNETVSERYILEQASLCGIRFGTNAAQIRSEKMKNALLQSIPQLQWAGINTNGCIAVINVREKTASEKIDSNYPVSSMVAVRDGYVTSISVTSGSAVCKPGQSVKEGQMLISAYTDCGLYIQSAKAKGDVFADTTRQVKVITPDAAVITSRKGESKSSYALIFGKKQINFTKDSGISTTQCDRIKLEYYVTLPGGFQLPLGLSVITEYDCTSDSVEVTPSDASSLLTKLASHQLDQNMVAGVVLQAEETLSRKDGAYCLSGSYQCNEMICIPRTEEIMK